MSLKRRTGRAAGAGETVWGVIEIHHPRAEGGWWTAIWLELGGRGRASIECNLESRANTICRDAWLRARRALTAPSRIAVLDEQTARRVRAAVPASVPVAVEERGELRSWLEGWRRGLAGRENTQAFFN